MVFPLQTNLFSFIVSILFSHFISYSQPTRGCGSSAPESKLDLPGITSFTGEL